MMENSSNMATSLQVWNREQFGNVHGRKRKLLARLEGIQSRLAFEFHNDMIKLKNKLIKESEEMLK